MIAAMATDYTPQISPLGDNAVIVRFESRLEFAANERAISFAQQLSARPITGVTEIASGLVSVLVRYDFAKLRFSDLAGELRLLLGTGDTSQNTTSSATYEIGIRFGGKNGPDLLSVAKQLNLSPTDFIKKHNASPLRVLATGFAPGFVYCGMHANDLVLPRRPQVRAKVPAGTVLFAAGQTAITATPIPTGWHVIGHTDFTNFDPNTTPPTKLRPGDEIIFMDAKQ